MYSQLSAVVFFLGLSRATGLPNLLSFTQHELPFLRHRRSAAAGVAISAEGGRCNSQQLTAFSQCAARAIGTYQTPLQQVYQRMLRGEPVGITRGGFDQFCNKHHSMTDCMELVPQHCRTTLRSEYQLVRNAITVGCSSQRAVLSLASHSCNSSVDPRLLTEQCMWNVIRQAVRNMGQVVFRNVLMEKNPSLCPYLLQEMRCLNSSLITWCGSQLTNVLNPIIHEFVTDNWNNELLKYGCSLRQ